MKGLIYRDLLSYYRRRGKADLLFSVGFLLLFALLPVKGIVGIPLYCLCVIPLSMSAMPTTFKEMDINYHGALYGKLFPREAKEVVGARFLSSYILAAMESLFLAVMLLAQYFLYREYAPEFYLQMFFWGWAIGMLLTTANLLTCYTVSLVASSVIYMALVAGAAALYLFSVMVGVDWLGLFLGSAQWLAAGVVVVGVLFVGLSYGIALKFYTRKA